ncbi:hypothetical protein, partial [Morganella morganii]|uniref:hypothetical protein n=1 Tax=Morganella morganii TaxID=582 RepID=UPI001BD65FDD
QQNGFAVYLHTHLTVLILFPLVIYTDNYIAFIATIQISDAIYATIVFHADKENGKAIKRRRLREEIMKGSGMESLLCYAPGTNKRG